MSVLSVAPMLDYTDSHFRYLIRLISKQVLLYTEMLTIKEVLNYSDSSQLQSHHLENPVAIQLGGSQPDLLAKCAIIAQQLGYTEVNLNVGCPSHRVQQGAIGACLMLQPALVAECINAMKQESGIPISVKCRLGVDEFDDYQFLHSFVRQVSDAGCHKFIVHARKAWLKGLSPKQNREIPPLQYDRVLRLKADFPQLTIILNGGITSLETAQKWLQAAVTNKEASYLDGVMMGRAIYQNPFLLAKADKIFFNKNSICSNREEVILSYCQYMKEQLLQGARFATLVRPLFNMFQGKPGAKNWRRYLSCQESRKKKGIGMIYEALGRLSRHSSEGP